MFGNILWGRNMEIEVEKTLVAKKSPKGFWEQTGAQKSPTVRVQKEKQF